jgi:hypothetical protein
LLFSQVLSQEKNDIDTKLNAAESRLSTLEAEKRLLAKELKLDDGATVSQMINKLNELCRSSALSRERVDHIETELKEMKKREASLIRDRDTLRAHSKNLELKLRQRELQKKTYERPDESRTSNSTCRTSVPRYIIDDPYKKLNRSKTTIEPVLPSIVQSVNSQYCVFCRQQYHGGSSGASLSARGPLVADRCRIHYRAYRNGRYECCHDPVAGSPGCMTVRHLFVEVTDGAGFGRSRIYTLTDGIGFRIRMDQQGFYAAAFDRRRN